MLPFSESQNDDSQTEALAINDNGVVAGLGEDPANPRAVRPVLWYRGRRIFVPAAAEALGVVNDLSADRLVGHLLVGDVRHLARWSFTARFSFRGFFAPVVNPGPSAPYRVNQVKAGQPITVAFSLGGNEGLRIFASGSPASKPAAGCALTGAGGAAIRMAGSGLTYDAATDRYRFVWQTSRGWAGTCRQLSVTLLDGTTHKALFRFTP